LPPLPLTLDHPPTNTEPNDIEFRISSAYAWLDEICTVLKTDGYFGKIVTVLIDGMPNFRELPACKAKDWRKAVVCTKNFLLQDEGLLYRSTDDQKTGVLYLYIPI
jgi:hypothetical protein